jgi:hypothetical protein
VEENGMNKSNTSMKLITAMFLLIAACAGAQTNLVSSNSQSLQGMIEERDFLARMRVICTPSFWVSYEGVLHPVAKGLDQKEVMIAFKAAKQGYLVLTNKQDRRNLLIKYISSSGVDVKYQSMILDPKSLGKGFSTIGRYTLIQSLENGDAIIKDSESTFYIYSLGRAADDKDYMNAELVKEGLKTYTTTLGGTKTVESYTSVSLSSEEIEALSKISASFSRRVSELTAKIDSLSTQQKGIIKY